MKKQAKSPKRRKKGTLALKESEKRLSKEGLARWANPKLKKGTKKKT